MPPVSFKNQIIRVLKQIPFNKATVPQLIEALTPRMTEQQIVATIDRLDLDPDTGVSKVHGGVQYFGTETGRDQASTRRSNAASSGDGRKTPNSARASMQSTPRTKGEKARVRGPTRILSSKCNGDPMRIRGCTTTRSRSNRPAASTSNPYTRPSSKAAEPTSDGSSSLDHCPLKRRCRGFASGRPHTTSASVWFTSSSRAHPPVGRRSKRRES